MIEIIIVVGVFLLILHLSETGVAKSNTSSFDNSNHSNSFKSNRYYRKNRVTHCHYCKTKLNSEDHDECTSCSWLICPECGACGYDCLMSKSLSRTESNREENPQKIKAAEYARAISIAQEAERNRIAELAKKAEEACKAKESAWIQNPQRIEKAVAAERLETSKEKVTEREQKLRQIKANVKARAVEKEKLAERETIIMVPGSNRRASTPYYLNKPLVSAEREQVNTHKEGSQQEKHMWKYDEGDSGIKSYEDSDHYSDYSAEMNDWENDD